MTLNQEVQLRAVLTTAHFEHSRGLNAHASFKLDDKARGEDLVQDTFMKTWRYLVKNGKIDLMKAFLYHVLNGLIIDEYRKHKTTSLDVLLEKGFEPGDDTTEQLFNTLDGKAAALLIQDLPIAYRKVMRMRYIQDLTLTEMSLLTGQTKNTIAVKTHRGLQKLKKLYHLHKAARETHLKSKASSQK